MREEFSGTRPIGELCRYDGIAAAGAALYYNWQERLIAAAVAGLENKRTNENSLSPGPPALKGGGDNRNGKAVDLTRRNTARPLT